VAQHTGLGGRAGLAGLALRWRADLGGHPDAATPWWPPGAGARDFQTARVACERLLLLGSESRGQNLFQLALAKIGLAKSRGLRASEFGCADREARLPRRRTCWSPGPAGGDELDSARAQQAEVALNPAYAVIARVCQRRSTTRIGASPKPRPECLLAIPIAHLEISRPDSLGFHRIRFQRQGVVQVQLRLP